MDYMTIRNLHFCKNQNSFRFSCIINKESSLKRKKGRAMNKQKIGSILRRFLPPVLALLLVAAFLLYCEGRVQTEFPELFPQDGVLDVREVDFSADVYHLDNHWDYYPGQLLSPDRFSDPASAPEKDNDAPLNVTKGTWRLRINAESNTYLTLCSYSIDYSTRIFVNGQEVRNIGFVSDDPAQAIPKVRHVTLPLYFDDSGETEIIYQYANYVHNEGGFIQNTLISIPENIDKYQRGLTLNAMTISGGLLMLFFYFLFCAAFQTNREYAALALCCLIIALRNHHFFVQHLLPEAISFYIEYRLVILDASWIPLSTVFLLAAFFPRTAGKMPFLAFACLCMVLSALHFILDTHDLVLLCHICYFICLPFALWFLIRLFLSFRKQKPGALDGIALFAILFFISMLIREGMATGSNSSVNHFGITPLAVLVCILLLAIVNNEKISRQMAQLHQVQQRNELLLQMNATNNDFLRTVAHELKTPLTVISGYAQLIERQMKRDRLSEKTPERLETIHSEADRLAEMVSQLMDYTYGKAKTVEMTCVNIDELLRSASAIMTPVCEKKQNALIFQNDSASHIHGNAELLLQVLINLIVNASRHTDSGQITVDAKDNGSQVAISVSDTGSGIAPEDASHIFEKGYTTDYSRGLGLSICADVVRLHGGRIALVSTGPEGSVFRFTVPREVKS